MSHAESCGRELSLAAVAPRPDGNVPLRGMHPHPGAFMSPSLKSLKVTLVLVEAENLTGLLLTANRRNPTPDLRRR